MFGQSGTCVNLWNRYSTLEVERDGSKDAEYESWIGWIPRNLHLRFFPWNQPNFGLPFIPGHEVVGKIALVKNSEKYPNLKIGQRVVIDNHFYCDKCDMCDEGACHMCPTFQHYGFGGGVDQGEVYNYRYFS